MNDVASKRVGDRMRRLEDPALLRGAARFVDDFPEDGTLHGAFVRSPLAHAAIASIDPAAALELPGVVAVLTLESLGAVLATPRLPLGFRNAKLPPDVTPHVLANGEVAYVGEPVALVLASSRYIAEDASALVEVEYDPLPVVADCRSALDAASPTVRREVSSNRQIRYTVAYGETDAAFARATRVVRRDLWQHRGGAHPIEGRGIHARYDRDEDFLTVWSSTQMPHELFHTAAEMLALDENTLRVATPDVGGGFGCKYAVYGEEIAVIAAAKLLRQDVKWIEDRREHFVGAIQERDQYWSIEMALDADARILGIRGHLIHDQGAYTLQDINLSYNAASSVSGPYVVPAYRIDVDVALTNKVPTIPIRGAGYPEACFAMERLMDSAAAAFSLDRAEIRRRNLIPAAKMPYEKPLRSRSGAAMVYDSGDFPGSQAELLEAADWAGFPARQAAARAAGRLIGIGLGHGVKGTGRGPFESGIVRIMPSGKVTVSTGAAPMGQGLGTALAQICAEQLGIDPADVTVVMGDTRGTQLGLGGFGSRQLVMAGSSVSLATREVATKVRRLAAHLLEAAEVDLVLKDGRVYIDGVPEKGFTLGRLAAILRGAPGYPIPAGMEPGLDAEFNFRSDSLAYANVCHVAEVEVDPETGGVTILRYTAMQDSGRLINPLIVDGQVHGSIAHGIGNALFEWMGYDAEAQPVTTTFAEYLLPTATELPFFEALYKESPSPLNPLGAKGVGEVATVPVTAAIISAVEDALSPYEVSIERTPISPGHLFELIAAGTKAAA